MAEIADETVALAAPRGYRRWAAWFLALIVLSAVFAAFDFRPNDVDSGGDAQNPGLTPSRFLDDDYYREIDNALTDNLATRGMGLWLRVKIDSDVFGDSTNLLVTANDDEWLFLTTYISPACEDLARIGLHAPLDEADDYSIPVRFIVTEPKSSLYPDRVPASIRPDPCVDTERQTARARLDRNALVLDIHGPLQSLVDAGDQVFYPRDTHWSPPGRLAVAETIVDGFAPGLWDPEALVPSVDERVMDLPRLLGIDETVRTEAFTVERGEVIVDERVDQGNHVLRFESRSLATEVVPGVTVIVGDSQLGYLLPDLAPYFERLVFVNWLAADLGATEFSDIPPPDQLLIESVERDAAGRYETEALAALLNLVKTAE